MFSVILVLFYFKCALSLQKPLCRDVDECLINAMIERVYPRFVAGTPGVVESSDPLHIDSIVEDLPTIRYELYNASLTGLKNCEFVELDTKHISDYTSFDYAVVCPVLTLEAQYGLNGIIDSIPIEGKGDCKITYEGYHISISGKLEKVTGSDGKQHVDILDYTIIADLRDGKVKSIEYKNLAFSADDSSNRGIIVEEITRDIVMEVFMNKYVQNLKDFHRHVPIEDLHYKYV